MGRSQASSIHDLDVSEGFVPLLAYGFRRWGESSISGLWTLVRYSV